LDRERSRPRRDASGDGIRFDAVPKRGGGTRWLTRLDPAGEAAYRRAVAPLVGRIERSLGPEVLALRAHPTPDGWRLASWRRARSRWRRMLLDATRGARPGTAYAVADVRDCYGSISPETLLEALGPDAAAAVVELRRFSGAGVRGLPVGPESSAVLANAILAELDRAARESGVTHVRWVDDLALWGPRGDVLRALAALEGVAARRGLTLNDGKTRLLAGREELRSFALGWRDSSIIAAP
jgi:hypothetical protein